MGSIIKSKQTGSIKKNDECASRNICNITKRSVRKSSRKREEAPSRRKMGKNKRKV
jgi:hypothetical protein